MTGGGITLDGPFRADGYTKNSADGNTTTLSNLVVYFREGKLTANGHYGAGTNYNDAQRTQYVGYVVLQLCFVLVVSEFTR